MNGGVKARIFLCPKGLAQFLHQERSDAKIVTKKLSS